MRHVPSIRPIFASTLAALAMLSFGSTSVAAATTTGAASASSGAWAATRTRAHAPAYAVATDDGAMAEVDSVPIAVTLKLRDPAALGVLTDRLQAGRAAQALSSAQFLERHAPTLDQVNRVVAHLRSNGFQNIVVAANRLVITADGTPGRVRSAFQAELHYFDVGGRRAYANVTDALVPATLSDAVLAVVGLQTVHLAHTHAIRLPAAVVASRQGTTQATTQASVAGIHPTLFPQIYGANGMPSASTATIGVITQGSMTQTVADLKTFAANAGYPAPAVTVVTVGSASSDTSGVDEWNMDTQASLAAAGGTVAGIRLYTAPTLSEVRLLAAYNRAVSDNVAKVVNVSLGECENSASTSGAMASADQVFQAAVAQGQTFAVSSGDSGSYGCGGSTNAQSYPAVSPYVMAIGGTTLSTSGGTWAGETAWSCTGPMTCPQSAAGGTGGGVSLTEPAPAWQTAAGVLTTAGRRGVPDVSFDASPYSGALILVNGSLYQIGGTSLAAPLFTGFYSRIQAAHGNALGFPAQALYAGAASNPAWFHDVVSGSNGGYAAGVGWDYVTGYGSLQVQNFSSSLATPSTSTTWTTIAAEGQAFTVSGTQTVRYGAGSSWITLQVTGSGTCSNAFFGADPVYGTAKICQVASTSTADTTGWTQIATENQSFAVSGTQTVRYGAGSSWITLQVTGGGTCSNGFFGGDPVYGIAKTCQLASSSSTVSWTRVATEGQSFSVSGTRTVRYGAGSSFVTLGVTSSGVCSNAYFGSDPVQGVVKACDVAE